MKTVIKLMVTTLSLCAFKNAKSAPLQTTLVSILNLNTDEPVTVITKDTTAFLVRDTSYNHIDTKLKIAAARLRLKVAMARQFLIDNNYNSDICFMVDMTIPSGKKRFFVYNLKADSIEFSSMVSHGSGSYKPNCDDQLVFSNLPNSNATSLGRYKIGESYKGSYGLSYKLYGLDSTNNKAFQRSIVLHSDNYVPNKETYPYHIYESAGCPIVSPSFLTVIGKYLKASKKPVMLWVYN